MEPENANFAQLRAELNSAEAKVEKLTTENKRLNKVITTLVEAGKLNPKHLAAVKKFVEEIFE